MANRILLGGCAPEPLIHYLKALGVLRLVSEQRDRSVRGAWVLDGFTLTTTVDEDALVEFFLNSYEPTPIVAPWNGGSGFYPSTSSAALDAILASTSPRLASYREAIEASRKMIAGRTEAPKEDVKEAVLRACRAALPDAAVRWIDAAFVLGEEKPDYPPLLGTGGNDGRLDFTNNFMARLVDVLPEFAGGRVADRTRELSERRLRSAFFGSGPVELLKTATGQFFPGGAGGANASEGLSGESLVNPWDYILAIEGALTFASATVRQLAAGARSKASFPFTVQNSLVGYGTASELEGVRAEIWLPVWSRSATAGEVAHLFGEGRVRRAGRSRGEVRTGFDFVRAIAALGVDRGIEGFYRYAFLERNGKAYLAAPLGRVEVGERGEASLLSDVDRWLESLRRATRDVMRTPPRLVRARREVEETVFALCAQGGSDRLRAVLVGLGAAEAEVARGPRFRADNPDLPPLSGLSRRWAEACDDGSTEFQIAAALSSIVDKEGRSPIRCNLESVAIEQGRVIWTGDDLAAVWGAGTFDENIVSVLHRRSVEATKSGIKHPAIFGARSASLAAVAAYLEGEVDDARIEALLRGLALIDWRGPGERAPAHPVPATLPRAYAILKLLFLPGGLVPGGDGWHDLEDIEPVPYEPSLLPLVVAGRVEEALEIAARRLRSSHRPLLTEKVYWPAERGTRLASALLAPISRASVEALARLVLRNPTDQENQA